MKTTPKTKTADLITLMEYWAKTIAKNGGVAAVTIQEGADRLRELETELAALTAERDLLCRCLRGLVDEQNGAPLELRRKQWQAAMDEALAALDATEDAK